MSATVRAELIVPDPAHSSAWVQSYALATLTEEGIHAVGSTSAGITFMVDATQQYRVFASTVPLSIGDAFDGRVSFVDQTTGTTLFSAIVDDQWYPFIWDSILESGHVYRIGADASGHGDLETGTGFVGRSFTFSVNAIPEPSTLALAAVGGAGMLGYGWRRRKRA